MIVLGISALDNDAAASILVDGRFVAAAQEERFSRRKMHAGFPHRAIESVLKIAGVEAKDVEHVAYPFFPWTRESFYMTRALLKNAPANFFERGSFRDKLIHAAEFTMWLGKSISMHRRFHQELDSGLREYGWRDRLSRYEHHHAHAASAFYSAGYERALVFTLDWYGSALAGSVSHAGPSGIERLHGFKYPHSLGLFYSQVTSALGFRASRHEGKIVGLAAFGDPSVLGDVVRSKFRETDGDYRYVSGMDRFFARRLAKEHPREHVAAAYQSVLEKVVARFVEFYVKKYQADSICLAGGVTANVKLNQRILEVPGVRRVFVHPAMSDAGTGTGAAMAYLESRGEAIEPFQTALLGPDYSSDEIRKALEAHGLQYTEEPEVELATAKLLAEGNIVARFYGRMEYGPRALGNRSVLYHTADPKVNDWLNKKLDRTEFMPFAPATLSSAMDRCYKNLEGGASTARFMTITCDCTDWMKQHSPAAVHIDGTARPQLVDPETQPSFHKVLTEFERLTGVPSVINTSFNMHEEPIVCSPDDAIRAFLQAELDFLAIGNFIVPNPAKVESTREARSAARG
ncbi:MAG: carbamoyltransferase C-terminal domain-containing protein [Planctomycetota bacterium]